MTGSARIRNVVFSLATVLSLGFGAAQAFAAPKAAAETSQACDLNSCMRSCQFYGYYWGICEEFNGSTYCECMGQGPIIQPGGGW